MRTRRQPPTPDTVTTLPTGPVPRAAGDGEGPQITETECEGCGTRLAGLDGRYACGVCSWSNHWSEGHRELPTAQDDPDYPGPAVAADV